MFRFAFAFLSAGVLSANAAELRISVSDLVAEHVSIPLLEYSETEDVDLKIEVIGSLPALDRLRSDEIDLALIAVPIGDAVPRDQFFTLPFAYDIAVVVASRNNPIDEISLARLGGIFGSSEEFNFNTWGELGLSGWGNRTIKPLAVQVEDSVSLELFKNSVLKSAVMKPSVNYVRENEVLGLVESDAASIAVLTTPPQDTDVKVLLISKDESSPAFGPSEENVHYGDYPVRLPFYIVLNERDRELMKPLLRVLLGDEVAASLKANGFMPLPGTVRRKLLIDLELE